MAGEAVAPEAGAHAGNALKKNLGGLPVWAWAGIVLVGVGVAYFFLKNKGTPTLSTGSTPADNVMSQSGDADTEETTGDNGGSAPPPGPPTPTPLPHQPTPGAPEPPVPSPIPSGGGGPAPLPMGTHIIKDSNLYWYENPGSEDRKLLSAPDQQSAQATGQTPYLPIGTSIAGSGTSWTYTLPGTSTSLPLIQPPGAARISRRGSVLR